MHMNIFSWGHASDPLYKLTRYTCRLTCCPPKILILSLLTLFLPPSTHFLNVTLSTMDLVYIYVITHWLVTYQISFPGISQDVEATSYHHCAINFQRWCTSKWHLCIKCLHVKKHIILLCLSYSFCTHWPIDHGQIESLRISLQPERI